MQSFASPRPPAPPSGKLRVSLAAALASGGAAAGTTGSAPLPPSASKNAGRGGALPAVQPFVRADQLRSALLHFTVYLVGCGFLVCLYVIFLMVQPYFTPLFWAAVLSVPLHSVKKSLIEAIEIAWTRGRVHEASARERVGQLLALPLQLLCGPLWPVLREAFWWAAGGLVALVDGPVPLPTSPSTPRSPTIPELPGSPTNVARDSPPPPSPLAFVVPTPRTPATQTGSGEGMPAETTPLLRKAQSSANVTAPEPQRETPTALPTPGPPSASRAHRAMSFSGAVASPGLKSPGNVTHGGLARAAVRTPRHGLAGKTPLATPLGSLLGSPLSAPATSTRHLGGRRVATAPYRSRSPAYFQPGFSATELSYVVDSVVGNLKTAPSSAYFALLVRLSGLFVLYRFLREVPHELLLWAGAAAVALAAAVPASLLALRWGGLRRRRSPAAAAPVAKAALAEDNPFLVAGDVGGADPDPSPDQRGRFASATGSVIVHSSDDEDSDADVPPLRNTEILRRATSLLRRGTTAIAHAAALLVVRAHLWAYRKVDNVVRDRARLNQLITVCLIITSATSLVLLTVFISFRITQEANSLVDLVVEHIYENEAMRDQFRSVVADLRTSAMQYVDLRLAELSPGSNLTLAMVLDRLREGYYQLFEGGSVPLVGNSTLLSSIVDSTFPSPAASVPASTTASAEIVATLAAEVVSVAQSPGAVVASAPPAVRGHRPGLLFGVLPPALGLLLHEIVVQRNWSLLTDVSRLRAVLVELRGYVGSLFAWLWARAWGDGASSPEATADVDDEFVLQETSNRPPQKEPANQPKTQRRAKPRRLDLPALATQAVSSSLSLLSVVVLNALQVVYYGLDLVFKMVLFSVTLYTLLLADESAIHYVSRAVLLIDSRQRLRASIEGNIQNVLLVAAKLMCFHMMFVWLTFSVCEVDYVYSAMVVSGILSVLPLFSHMWIVVPAVTGLWMRGQLVTALVLGAAHVFVAWVVDPKIYSEIKGTNPFFATLFIILGFDRFGFEGLLWGPVIGSVPFVAYNLYGELYGSTL